MLTISTSPVMGMVNGCGYDSRQKDTICDVYGLCLTIQSTFKPVCCWFWLISYAYKLLKCLDVEIWQFSWWQQMDRRTNGQTDRLLYSCACTWDNNYKCVRMCEGGESERVCERETEKPYAHTAMYPLSGCGLTKKNMGRTHVGHSQKPNIGHWTSMQSLISIPPHNGICICLESNTMETNLICRCCSCLLC